MKVKLNAWLTNSEALGTDNEHFALAKLGLAMETGGWLLLNEVEVTLPEKAEIAGQVIAKLEERQRQIRARAEEVCQEIEEQIQNFLALEAPKEI